jgi:hypothetical protein
MRYEYELIKMLRKLKMGQLVQLIQPEGVPMTVWAVLQECLSINPQARPTTQNILASFEELTMRQRVGE